VTSTPAAEGSRDRNGEAADPGTLTAVQEIVRETGRLVALERSLVRLQLEDRVRAIVPKLVELVVALAMLAMALPFVGWGVARGLSRVIPPSLAAVSTAGMFAMLGMLLAFRAKWGLEHLVLPEYDEVPDQGHDERGNRDDGSSIYEDGTVPDPSRSSH